MSFIGTMWANYVPFTALQIPRMHDINPFTADAVEALHFATLV